MKVRPAEIRDFEALTEVFKEVDELHLAAHPERFQEVEGAARSRRFINGILENDDANILLAEVSGEVLGLVVIYIIETPPIPLLVERRYANLDTLIVKEKARRQGIATALLDAAHRWAEEKGAASVDLTVYQFNTSALQFYRAQGYAPISQKMTRSLHNDG